MSCIVDKRREKTIIQEKNMVLWEIYFQFISRVYLKSICFQSFQFMTLNTFKQLEWNVNRKFSLDMLPRSLSLRICCWKIVVCKTVFYGKTRKATLILWEINQFWIKLAKKGLKQKKWASSLNFTYSK